MMKSLVETTSHFFTPGITTSRDKRKKKFNRKAKLKNSSFQDMIQYENKKIELKVFLAIREAQNPTDPYPEHCHILKKYLRIQKTVALAV
jgi:hypothetical protein